MANNSSSEHEHYLDLYWRKTLHCYSILKSFDESLLDKLTIVNVFDNGDSAFMLTGDDKMYGVTTRAHHLSKLGLDPGDPKQLPELSGKGIQRLVTGSKHVLAMTENGKIYAFGANHYGQLGIGDKKAVKTELNQIKNVCQVAAGLTGSLALTYGGEVYCWGTYGSLKQFTPALLILPDKIKFISCGYSHCLALADNGNLYSWGSNECGELGHDMDSKPSPRRVLYGVNIVRAVCGQNHSLALDEQGSVYTMGDPSPLPDKTSPIRLQSQVNFIDIAAHHDSRISMAKSTSSEIYIWGEFIDSEEEAQQFKTPTKTEFSKFEDVYAMLSITGKSIEKNEHHPTIAQTITEAFPIMGDAITKAFNSRSSSDINDLKFKIDGKQIHCNKLVLSLRSKHLHTMLESDWKETSKGEIVITHSTYNVYHAYIKYLYTDEVNISPNDAIDLIILAHLYSEDYLIRQCEKIVKNLISEEQVASLYAMAVKYECRLLKELCVGYAVDHLTGVTESVAFGAIEPETAVDLIRRAGRRGAFIH